MRHPLALLLILFAQSLCAQSYPDGFIKEIAFNQFDAPAGMLHTDSAIAFVWELSGKVWLIDDGVVYNQPVLDISEEVGFWGDHGMLGAALDPNFFENGYIYLWYAVDRHHLLHYGTPEYNPEFSESGKASIGRITRYQLNTVNFQFVIPESRHILLGDQINNGLPLASASHGVGSLLFGKDGTLLASSGDGSTWVRGDNNLGYNGTGTTPNYAYDEQALADGILTPDQYLGSYRSQSLNGLNGKVLRINPETGEGIPNNPFYDSQNPDAPVSKVWALGFRNPYRMTMKPGTGDENRPGTVYISDVGDWVWEEINVISEPGKNYGWPMYQGQDVHDLFYLNTTVNTYAPNPLSPALEACSEYFNFQDLIRFPNQLHNVDFPNPCNIFESVPSNIHTFMVERPSLAYSHVTSGNEFALIPTFDADGNASYENIENTSEVSGTGFKGIGGSGGAFLQGDSIPEEFQNWFVQIDYSGWLRGIRFDEFDEVKEIEFWDNEIGSPIHISTDPSDGSIYVVSISPREIYKISFGGNRKPEAIANIDTLFGPSPQNLVLDATQSFDLDGEIVDYTWTLSTGESYQGAVWNYVATAPSNDAFYLEAKILVTDNEGAKDSSFVLISLNNTPPTVDISSLTDNQILSIYNPSFIDLIASVQDAEHSPDELTYDWTIYLNHNTHFHRLDEKTGNNNGIMLSPLGCNDSETYWYRIVVKVTDPGNLTATDTVELWPDCEGILDQKNSENEYTLYPNPSQDEISIDANFDVGQQVEYTIISSDGKEVAGATIPIYSGRRNFSINISELSQSAYVLQIKSSVGTKQLRFVKIDG